ncbi:class I adenylate-forming enzyme family protein [Frankia sp. AgKG'84/4]|uniref:class I adenylate-forming enzyme family protein n=1 Tax=Frankia sp. AgKG'84/4 TaxID=573490 RepID=UPI00200F7988|nr:class I adenylate-forming enzyme family protein [Frankia sp. AgKG'84/4]MCL9793999.1 acyl--CoA ligase [Frankia sp. AgKG'84/4]
MLFGPGAPFEFVREDVRGVEMSVFARRPKNVVEILLAAPGEHGDQPYLILPERTITFTEAGDTAARIATVLRERHGIERGDRVALAGANSGEHALTLWAVIMLGAVAVGLNGWWTGPEFAAGVALTEPRLIAGDSRRLERLSKAVEAGPPTVLFDELLAAAAGVGPATGLPVDLPEDDPAAVLFTSGTTGAAKGALISHRAIVNFGMDAAMRGAVEVAAGAATRPSGPSVSVHASPFFHISGLGTLIGVGPKAGLTMVFAPPGRWDPAAHLSLSVKYGVTQWSGVPTQILRLLEHPDFDSAALSTIRSIGCGGAAMPPELPRLVQERLPGATVNNGHGMTETFGLGTAIGGPRLAANLGSAGVPTPTAEVELRDPAGTEVTADGEIGEIWLRCPSMFLGYWNNPAATAAVLDPDGWYRTGDYGRFDAGLLFVESRLRDMIIRGGENIYPIEIENRLVDHPHIAEAAVIGTPHRELGQEVMAVVVAREGATVEAAAVRSWVATTLAGFKVPAHVRVVDALPYSASGKVLKRDLEVRFAAAPAATPPAATPPEPR